MNLGTRFSNRAVLLRLVAALAAGLPIPAQAAGTAVTIDCFRSADPPLLSADGIRTGRILELPIVGKGIPATYDDRGLLHFKIGQETFTIAAEMAQLQGKPQPTAKSDPVGGAPRQSFATKGASAEMGSSLCADR